MDLDEALRTGPAVAATPELGLFARFTGEWRVRNRLRASSDDEWIEAERTWVFARILGGRAMQDVLLGTDADGATYALGTTVRAFDPAIEAWRVHWMGAAHGNFVSVIARSHGTDGIHQDGVEHLGEREIPVRWNFSEITDRSFVWHGWSSADGGRTWWLEQHMEARRHRRAEAAV